MTIIQAIILGIVQGITEFLPISSSAHLVIVPHLLQWDLLADELFIFDVLVQMGTLVAVIIIFRKLLWSMIRAFVTQLFAGQPFATHEARLAWLLIIATIPAGIVGYFFEDQIAAAFSSLIVTGIGLIVTAALMLLAEMASRRLGDLHDVTIGTALWMGIMQSLAVLPGISRSGATISGGMLHQLKREPAGKFSFLMSIPIMLAAGGLSTLRMVTTIPNLVAFLPVMLAGFFTALIVGYLSIRWLLRFLTAHSLIYFSVYCALLGVMILLTQAR